MRERLALIALACLLISIGSGCRAMGPLSRAGGGNAPAPPVIDVTTAELEGGAEHLTRPHEDPKGAYSRGDRRYRTIALTFDDGPDRTFTPQVLDILKRNGVHATFFLVGERAVTHPDLVKRIQAEGHDIGNHSWSHPFLTRIPTNRVMTELTATDYLLRRLTGKPVRFFRPPYGAINPEILKVATSMGYQTILWDIDSQDWKKGMTKEGVLKNVIPYIHQGAIVLEHSAGGKGEDLTDTLQALPEIIKALKSRGYRIVTLSEMMATGKPIPGQW